MKPTLLSILGTVLLLVCSFSASTATAADTLKDKLVESGWDDIIGTWKVEGVGVQDAEISYSWKFEDSVIEVNSKMGELESFALMGVNGKTGEVFHMGVDGGGSSSLGTWRFEEGGDAVQEVQYTRASGREGEMSVRYHKEEKDSITMTIERPRRFAVKLVRAK